jgi:glycosyltransferase involved in cell wall biosynthesis
MEPHAPAVNGARRSTLVHLVIALDAGGLETLLLRLVARQVAAWDVHVVCLERPGTLASHFERIGVQVHSVDGEGLGLVVRLARLERQLRRLHPTVIHTHNLAPHVHGVFTYPLSGARRLIHTRHGQHALESRHSWVVNRLSRLLTRAMIAVSNDAARYATDGEGFPAAKVHVIHNGVEVSRYRAASGPVDSAVAVGRLAHVKGFDVLVEAVALVRQILPRFSLRIVGEGPERPALERRIAELHLDGAVELIGYKEDPSAYFEEAGLYVLSSRSEGIPLTLLEAMACGLPIVATRAGGVAEIVGDGQEALLVRPGDAPALAAAIVRLATESALASRLGRAARARARMFHDLETMTARYEALYQG